MLNERRKDVIDRAVLHDKPMYTHDCERCAYLGFDKTDDGALVDLYFCEQHNLPTVIARYSSVGSDYVSGVALCGNFPELRTAKTRATEVGFIF